MATFFQQLRATAAVLTSNNPTLAAGQLGFETDTLKFKLGDGSTVWTSLGYVTSAAVYTTATGISAINPPSQGSGPLTAQVNEVTVVGTDGDNVTLPTAVTGEFCVVINNDTTGTNALAIFPASADDLGAGVNTKMTIDLAHGDMATFFAYDTTNWAGTVTIRVN